VPKHWIVERTFGWLSRYRRMSKDDERKVQTSETLITVAMSRLALARLGRQTEQQAEHAVSKQPVYTP
jgi:putative transposase